LPYATPRDLERVGLENKEPSGDWIFPHKFTFDSTILSSTGCLKFSTRVVRNITISFVLLGTVV